MTRLSPDQIILHCGLHKTGSTYIQRSLRYSHKELLELGILYLGPTTFKNQFRELWRYIESGKKTSPTTKITQQAKTSLLEIVGENPQNIRVIFLSYEGLFGTLSKGLIAKIPGQKKKNENKNGLYRYARPRVSRLMGAIEETLGSNAIQWTLGFATRRKDDFIRSCHTQLLKEGHTMSNISYEEFKESINFSFSEPELLLSKLESLKKKRNITIIPFSYEEHSDKNNPTTYLWQTIKLTLPEYFDQVKHAIEANMQNINLDRRVNPSLSDRGLEIADQTRHVFNKQEWKQFRKFLEKYYPKVD